MPPSHRTTGSLPIALVLLVAALAFVRLMALPVFADEASQQRLIWRLLEHHEWLQALVDGKPLEVWLMAPFVRVSTWFGVQPVAAVRAVHVAVGMLGTLLMFPLATRIGGRKAGWVSALLFAICPLVVYLERLALADILLCTASIWTLLSVLQFCESPRASRAVTLGVALLGNALCKLPVGFVALLFMPAALLFMPREQRRRLLAAPVRNWLIAAHAPAVCFAAAVAAIGFLRMRGGHAPGFGLQDFIGISSGSTGDIGASMGLSRPTLWGEFSAQLTPVVVVIACAGLAAGACMSNWRLRWALACGLLPLLMIGLLPTFWYSRYLLFTLPPLIIAAVGGWEGLWDRAGAARLAGSLTVLAVTGTLLVYQSSLLVLDPTAARWSPVDRFQYLQGWGSGYGYPQAAQFILTSQAPDRIYSLDGHGAYQLRNYLPDAWRTRVQPVSYGDGGRALNTTTERTHNVLEHSPAWIIVPEPLLDRYLATSLGPDADLFALRRVAEFAKPAGGGQLAIYEIAARGRE